MSEVIDKPRTARRSVVLGRRVARSSAGFHWYLAGRDAERRAYWMTRARKGDAAMRPMRVKLARKYHHMYMRGVARALEMER